MGTFKSDLQKEVNLLPNWNENANPTDYAKSLNDKYNYQLNGREIFSENTSLKERPSGVSLNNWMGDLIQNHIQNPKIAEFYKIDKWKLNLEDNYLSSRDAFVSYYDRSQDYFRHRLNINNHTKKVMTDGNYTYIGTDGTNPNFSDYSGTSYENEDPVIYGFDIILDSISSPLLNKSVEDFITQFSSITEIASRKDVIFDFKQQLKKIFKTKGQISFGETKLKPQSSDFDDYAWSTNGQGKETSFMHGKVSYLSHYIQKIDGLDQLVERNTTEAHKPFSEWPKNKLTISFYEDVSGTMGSLAHLYKLLYWSVSNGKSLIPENLLRFNCEIVISEIRNFKRVIKAKNDNNIKVVRDNVSRYIYSLRECQFFFNKMPHDSTIDLSNTKVYGDGGPGFDIEMNWKFASTRFEKWTEDTGKTGNYVGYNSGTVWRAKKSSPSFHYHTADSLKLREIKNGLEENMVDDYTKTDRYTGLTKHSPSVNPNNNNQNNTDPNSNPNPNNNNQNSIENIDISNVNIYNSTNKDYIKFINKYQLVKSDGGSISQVANPMEYYENDILKNSGNLKDIYNSQSNNYISANTQTTNTFNNVNNNSNNTLSNTTVSSSLTNIYKKQNANQLNNSQFSAVNIFTLTNVVNNNNNSSNAFNIYNKPSTLIKNSVIYAIFNIYTKQNNNSLKNSVFTTIGNIFKNKI